MTITILGTAAAEGWPALFCNCPACSAAREAGGKNLRTRCSLQINDDLKIDLPPDTLWHSHRSAQRLSELKYLLITHSHSDHLAAEEIHNLVPPFALQDKSSSIRIFGNRAALDKILSSGKHVNIEPPPGLFNELRSFQTVSLDAYEITTIKASHKPEEECLNYLIHSRKSGTSLLYTCDTGFYAEESWDFLHDKRADLVITECTGGLERLDYGSHMGLPNVLDFRERAESIGLTGGDTRWILTHFSHTGGSLHEELEQAAVPHGFEVAWDGMEIEG
jgi:phosphoribosyl 1,2-cyclic phosphate phosphodiesterase